MEFASIPVDEAAPELAELTYTAGDAIDDLNFQICCDGRRPCVVRMPKYDLLTVQPHRVGR